VSKKTPKARRILHGGGWTWGFCARSEKENKKDDHDQVHTNEQGLRLFKKTGSRDADREKGGFKGREKKSGRVPGYGSEIFTLSVQDAKCTSM